MKRRDKDPAGTAKAKKRPGPVREVKRGSVTVKIYRGTNRKPDGREYPVFTVTYSERDRRERRFFADLDDAIDEAEKVALRLNQGEHRALQLTSADASSYTQALAELAPLGVPLHSAISEYVHVAKMLDGRPLAEAAKFFTERNRSQVTARPVGEVVDELLAERKREGKSVRYVQSLRSHLHRFKEKFQTDIGRVTTRQMEAWLSDIGGKARTRNNLRCSLVTLFHFARKRGYLARGIATEADEIGKDSVPASLANIYAPEDLQRLLAVADPRLLPALAIMAFTGLRTASVQRLRWENVKWGQSVIEIPAAIAKNGKRYLVPLLPCLAAWLAPYRGKKGDVVTGVRFERGMRELFAAAGVKRLHNGLRDSFISYRVAETKNIPQVAYEAGNSVEMIRSKYLEARTKAEAVAWFAVMPATPANLVQLDLGASA